MFHYLFQMKKAAIYYAIFSFTLVLNSFAMSDTTILNEHKNTMFIIPLNTKSIICKIDGNSFKEIKHLPIQ